MRHNSHRMNRMGMENPAIRGACVGFSLGGSPNKGITVRCVTRWLEAGVSPAEGQGSSRLGPNRGQVSVECKDGIRLGCRRWRAKKV